MVVTIHAHRVDALARAARHRYPRGIVGIARVPSSPLPVHCRRRHPHAAVTFARAPLSAYPPPHPRPSAPAHIQERVCYRLVQALLSVWLQTRHLVTGTIYSIVSIQVYPRVLIVTRHL